MVKTKNYCPTHHLYYNGYKCPICERERLLKMAAKYAKTDEEEPKEASMESIQKLINKFNLTKKK